MASVSQFFNFFQFPSLNTESELAKLVWLVRLRWMAIALFFLLTAPGLIFGYLDSKSVFIYIAIVSFLFLFNLLTQLIFIEAQKKIGPYFICFQLALDLMILCCLLLASGGFANPFTGLFLLNASLGGILITKRLGWPFLLLTHTLLAGLQLQFVQWNQQAVDLTLLGHCIVLHALVFLFWLVMRSLGAYLARQSESQAQVRLHLEKQDRLRALGSLAAGFSHEFASPLNAAKLRLERLKRLSQSEDVAEALASIQACEQVIHQMNSSQLDARDFHSKPVPIKNLLNDIMDSWKDEHPDANLEIQILVEDVLRVPPINLAQVVLNLLDNAYEAEPKKEIRFRFERQHQNYLLSVEDHGKGFPEIVLQKVGEPFVTTKVNGTGLGLYVSQLFSQSLGGEMSLTNIVGAGARVCLQWPALESQKG